MDDSYLNNCLKARLSDKKKKLTSYIFSLNRRLKSNKELQEKFLKKLVIDPKNDFYICKLEKLLVIEAKRQTQLDLKIRQLNNINSTFFKDGKLFIDNSHLKRIASFLIESLGNLSDIKTLQMTSELLKSVIEKVVIYSRRKEFVISEIDYGN